MMMIYVLFCFQLYLFQDFPQLSIIVKEIMRPHTKNRDQVEEFDPLWVLNQK